MTKEKKFPRKHGADVKPDNAIKSEILSLTTNGELPCAVAFTIVKTLNVSAAAVGMNADLINIKLAKCQLGLFGYEQNKIVRPLDSVDPDLKDALLQATENGKLSCELAWDIAAQFDIPKLSVGNACESLQIKIKPCQLGAF